MEAGFGGQASWISCVINLVNTSEFLLSKEGHGGGDGSGL